MDPAREVHGLTSLRDRVAGSDAERRAAKHLQGRLRALGRDPETEATAIRPRYGLTHAIHGLAAVVGSVVAVSAPVAGAVILLVVAISTVLDLSGLFHLTRRLTGERASQNVVSREDGGKDGVLVLVAHYDAGRDDAAFHRLARRIGDPWAVFLGAIGVVLICCAVRAAGVDSDALTVVQFIPTVVLVLLTPLLVDIELSPVARGEADDAGGVATVLRLAGDLGGSLDHFDLWVLFPGAAKPFGLGTRAWLRRHRKALDKERTVFVSIAAVGDGPLRYSRREGPVLPLRMHSRLVRLCSDIAEDAGDGEARAAVRRDPGDAATLLARGYPAISIWTEGADTDSAGLDRAFAFARELAVRLDAEVGPVIAAGAEREKVRQA